MASNSQIDKKGLPKKTIDSAIARACDAIVSYGR
jgi:hypothetical protein